MKKLKSLFSRFYLVLVLAFFYLPILYVIVFSFNDSKSLSKFTGFSLQWYERCLPTARLWSRSITPWSSQ